MSDGYDFFSSVRDGVSIWRALGAKMTNLVVVAVVKAPYCNVRCFDFGDVVTSNGQRNTSNTCSQLVDNKSDEKIAANL